MSARGWAFRSGGPAESWDTPGRPTGIWRACRMTNHGCRMIELATTYGRYGYRRITGRLRREGWTVNHTRVERLWRREGLNVPQTQPKRGRLWLADGSCLRRRPE